MATASESGCLVQVRSSTSCIECHKFERVLFYVILGSYAVSWDEYIVTCRPGSNLQPSLLQRQRQANHQRMDDEVLFITEGLKANSSTVLQSALHSLQLFRSEAQRDEMLEVLSPHLFALHIYHIQFLRVFLFSASVCGTIALKWDTVQAGVYADLLTSMSEVNSTGGLPGDTAALTTLLGAHVFMIHCNVVSSKGSSGQKAALTHVRMATLTKLLASMLSRRAYLSVEPNKSHLVELRKTKEVCRAWALLPPVRILSICFLVNLTVHMYVYSMLNLNVHL